MTFAGQDLLELEPHERAAAGLFLGFQYPVEIPGVSFVQFLRESLNAQRKSRGEEPLSGGEFLKLAREKAALLAGFGKAHLRLLERAPTLRAHQATSATVLAAMRLSQRAQVQE